MILPSKKIRDTHSGGKTRSNGKLNDTQKQTESTDSYDEKIVTPQSAVLHAEHQTVMMHHNRIIIKKLTLSGDDTS